MTDLDPVEVTETQRDEKARDARDQCQQIVSSADALHPLEELPSIQDTDAVKEHDQAGQPDGAHDLCLGGKCAEGEPNEQHGSNAERKSADADLTDQITQPDGQKCGEDWLRSNDLAGQIDHDRTPQAHIL